MKIIFVRVHIYARWSTLSDKLRSS